MPIETQRRGVVAELTATRLEDRLREVLYRLADVHVHAVGQDRGDVHARRVALQHAVGDEHQPVAHLQWQSLHPVAVSALQAERGVSLQTNVLDLSRANPKRRRMTGIDDARRRSGQVNPHEQTGHELAVTGLCGQRIIRQARLLGQLNSTPAGVA
jgi:hypothetical protein